MRKMLFEPNLRGHRLEYIHHIYMGMLNHPEDDFVIVVPKIFEEKKTIYDWPETKNIRFDFIDNNGERNNGEEESSLLKESFHKVLLLRKYIVKERIESVFLISFMGYLPFLPFMMPKGVRFSGILYKVYLYRWRCSSFLLKVKNVILYTIISRSKCIKSVFVLNDAPAARVYNYLYHTEKFRFITDPFNAISYAPKDIRQPLSISKESKVFFHFGGLNRRKGTLVILDAIKQLKDEDRKQITLIFAGKVYLPIYNEFYALLDEVSSLCHIIVYDQFVSNELIADLCISSDFILAPYGVTNQSSGILGYAACYEKPVIGPSQGLVGKLIKRYKLGFTMKTINAVELAKVMAEIVPYRLKTTYSQEISVSRFVNRVFELF